MTALQVLKKVRSEMRPNAKVGEYDLPVIIKAMHDFAVVRSDFSSIQPDREGIRLGQFIGHIDLYDGNQKFKIVGIRENEVELEGDFSGGTHNVEQKSWMPLEGVLHTCKYCNVKTTQPDNECYKSPSTAEERKEHAIDYLFIEWILRTQFQKLFTIGKDSGDLSYFWDNEGDGLLTLNQLYTEYLKTK